METDGRVSRRTCVAGDVTAAERHQHLSAIVGATMADRAHHRRNHAGVGGRAVEVDESGNAAHG